MKRAVLHPLLLVCGAKPNVTAQRLGKALYYGMFLNVLRKCRLFVSEHDFCAEGIGAIKISNGILCIRYN